jgi:CO/xanthine dehydrogenase FAD-binding subunit
MARTIGHEAIRERGTLGGSMALADHSSACLTLRLTAASLAELLGRGIAA